MGNAAALLTLAEFPKMEEIHTVAGDTCVVLKVRTADTAALEQLLARIYSMAGVQGTKSYVVVSTCLGRPVRAEVTKDWGLDGADTSTVAR